MLNVHDHEAECFLHIFYRLSWNRSQYIYEEQSLPSSHSLNWQKQRLKATMKYNLKV